MSVDRAHADERPSLSEWAVRDAERALAVAKSDLAEIATLLLYERTMDKATRVNLGQRINAARARITTAELKLRGGDD